MSLRKFKSSMSFALVGLAGASAIGFGLVVAQWQLQTAWNVHVERIDKDMQVKGEKIGHRLQSLVDNMRTVAFTPAVRRIESAEQLLSPLDQENLNLIVSRISAKFAGTQVYVVPSSYNPERLDPSTGFLQAPAICFNCAKTRSNEDQKMFANPLPGSSVTQSQREVMKQQIDWFNVSFAKRDSFFGMDAPIISSVEINILAPASKNGGTAQHILNFRACVANVAQPPPRLLVDAADQKSPNRGGCRRGKRRPVRLATENRGDRVREGVASERDPSR